MAIRSLLLLLTLVTCAAPQRQVSAPPRQLTFPARPGYVVFDHSLHSSRVHGECRACHDRLFLPDAKAPLKWKPGTHKPAEANQTSCGGCHRPGGPAFQTKDNCRKCHVGEPEL